MNVPARCAAVIWRDPPLATLHELNTVYSLRDLYDLIEIAAVDAYNQRIFDEARAKEIAEHADRH